MGGRARHHVTRIGAVGLLMAGALVAGLLVAGARAAGDGGVPLGPLSIALAWQHRRPGVVFRESSPVEARLATPAAVVGAHDGKLYAFDLRSGSSEPGWPAKTNRAINSSTAAADLTGSGHDDVIVGS